MERYSISVSAPTPTMRPARDWEKDHYNLGDNEIHLAFTTDDMEASHKKHQEMGCICYENPGMGIYFISDPDGYWLEIVPAR